LGVILGDIVFIRHSWGYRLIQSLKDKPALFILRHIDAAYGVFLLLVYEKRNTKVIKEK
jgi:hypothetical protein